MFKCMKTKQCKNCGKEYRPNSNSQKNCVECRVKKCAFCGKVFEIKGAQWSKKFCSSACVSKHYPEKIQKLQENRGVKPRKRKESQCLVCECVFEHWVGREPKYCSKKCWSKRNPKILNLCFFCGKDFWSYKHQDKKYCSKKCYGFSSTECKTGENANAWKGGRTEKSKILRTRKNYLDWRNSVFERDEWTCQKCGIKSKKGCRIHLHAHHKKTFSDHPELRTNIDNGVTLCKNCHLLEHSHKF